MKKKSLGQIGFESFNTKTDITWEDVESDPTWVKNWEKAANAVAREIRKRDKEKYSTERLSRLLMKGKKK